MSSGVQPTPECLEKYQELKTGKKIAFIIFGLSADKKNIEVLKVSEDRDFDAFVAELPEKDSRYAVLDFEYDLEGDGKRSKILFVQWSPDEAPVRSKMLASSSKDALRRRLDGVAAEIQASDYSEITREVAFEKVNRR